MRDAERRTQNALTDGRPDGVDIQTIRVAINGQNAYSHIRSSHKLFNWTHIGTKSASLMYVLHGHIPPVVDLYKLSL